MSEKGKYPILSNGEYYVEPLSRKYYGGEIQYPHEYEEAKERLYSDIEKIQHKISDSDEVFIDKKIVCIRLEPKFEAKSYKPNAILTNSNIRLVGGRKYTLNEDKNEKGKLYFLRTTEDDLENLKINMSSGQKDDIESWKNQIRTIKSIDLLNPEEKILGFDDEWKQGGVEAIIHPLGDDTDAAINGFFDITGLEPSNTMIRTYDDGLTFVCAYMDRDTIDKVKMYNPLRSIKPTYDEINNPLRMTAITDEAPKLPKEIFKSSIKIGVFDGGVKKGTTLLDNYVTNYDMVDSPPNEDRLEHGSAVCGAVLFGKLNGLSKGDEVENPVVSVESFRVFPAKKTGNAFEDYQMYTTIDIIEKVVRERRDIKLFNISHGPKGAILDDDLNRFTYACDKLAYDVEEGEDNPLFCIAVGNDGELMEPANRIQAPADMVNGIAVGAYTFDGTNSKIRASYSCVGPGREGAKIKPDLLEFGGTADRPFIAVMSRDNLVGVKIGTSLAAPTVAGKIGRLMAKSNNISPHLGRTLLIHNAESEEFAGNKEEGFGLCPENIENILECTDNKVTILYSGEITSSNSVKLPIFMPEVDKYSGKTKIQWTISTVVNPNVNDPDAYTNNCIEDTLYPHDMTFNFSKRGKGTKKINLLDEKKISEAEELMRQGYSQSLLPASKSAKKSYREADLRNDDFKWDTVMRKQVSMMTTSLRNPFLSLHAIGRDEYEHEKIKYYVAITVDVPSYQGSLYDNILQNYSNLVPITIQNVNRILTKV